MTTQPVRTGLALTAIAVGAFAFALSRPSGREANVRARSNPAPRTTQTSAERFRRRFLQASKADERRRVLAEIARFDPAAAMELAEAAEGTPLEKYALASKVVAIWAERDPLRCWDWVLRNSNRLTPDDLDPLFTIFMRATAARDPQRLAELVDTALNGSSKFADPAALMNGAVSSLLGDNRADLAQQAIARWYRSSPEAPVPPATATSVALYLASSQSPESAAAWLGTLPPSEARKQATEALATEWTNHDPQAAMAWSIGLPSEAGLGAAERALGAWMDRDPGAANEWVGNHSAP